MLLQRREEVELEADPRVAGGHDPVGDELAVAGAAEMAIEAVCGARARIVERHHAARDIGGVGAADRIMAGKPARGGAVAALAADSVGGLEAGAARAAGPAWRGSRGTSGAVVASPMPSRRAIACARGSRSTRQARLCAPAGVARILPDHAARPGGRSAPSASAAAMAGGAAADGDADIVCRRLRNSARSPRPSAGMRPRTSSETREQSAAPKTTDK